MNNLDALETKLGHHFSDPELLKRALTHASAHATLSNERLEFLGDRVLGLIIAENIHTLYADDAEGALALKFNALARGAACARAAEAAELSEHIILAQSERASGGRQKPAILSMDAARNFVERYWSPMFESLGTDMRDAKTRLQEWAQSPERFKDGRGGAAPVYTLIGRKGPDHQPRFVVAAAVEGHAPEQGEGGSKREAEQDAAAKLLMKVETT